MIARSNRAEVRNPVIGLRVFAKLRALPAPVLEVLRELFAELAAESRVKAEECWRKHKAPMAAYWKAVSVYANHIKRSLR